MCDEKIVYSVNEMAQVLGLGKNKAYELISQEGFPSFRIGKKILINKSGLSKWLQDQSSKSI